MSTPIDIANDLDEWLRGRLTYNSRDDERAAIKSLVEAVYDLSHELKTLREKFGDKDLAVAKWLFDPDTTCNKFLLTIFPDGTTTYDGGHTYAKEVAKALWLRNKIDCIRKTPGERHVMMTIQKVPEFKGKANEDAINTLNSL